MDFNQLKEAYLKVLEENRELKIEINKFKQQLRLMDPVETIPMADLSKDSIISNKALRKKKLTYSCHCLKEEKMFVPNNE